MAEFQDCLNPENQEIENPPILLQNGEVVGAAEVEGVAEEAEGVADLEGVEDVGVATIKRNLLRDRCIMSFSNFNICCLILR